MMRSFARTRRYIVMIVITMIINVEAYTSSKMGKEKNTTDITDYIKVMLENSLYVFMIYFLHPVRTRRLIKVWISL